MFSIQCNILSVSSTKQWFVDKEWHGKKNIGLQSGEPALTLYRGHSNLYKSLNLQAYEQPQ